MQVIIDISEEDYNFIKEVDESNYFVTINLYTAVYEGIILPKGHGRLIDADTLNRKDINYANVPMNFIDISPTIIEADDTESEE